LRGATGKFSCRVRPSFDFVMGFEPTPTCCSKHAYPSGLLSSHIDASEIKKTIRLHAARPGLSIRPDRLPAKDNTLIFQTGISACKPQKTQ